MLIPAVNVIHGDNIHVSYLLSSTSLYMMKIWTIQVFLFLFIYETYILHTTLDVCL